MTVAHTSRRPWLAAIAATVLVGAAALGVTSVSAQSSGRLTIETRVEADRAVAPGSTVMVTVSANGVDSNALGASASIEFGAGARPAPALAPSCSGDPLVCELDARPLLAGEPVTVGVIADGVGGVGSRIRLTARARVDHPRGIEIALAEAHVDVLTLPDLAVDLSGPDAVTVANSSPIGVQDAVIMVAFRPGARLPDGDGWSCALDLSRSGYCRLSLGALEGWDEATAELGILGAGTPRVLQVVAFDGEPGSKDANPRDNSASLPG